jgi:RNA polymerase sigma-70 factor (ECF subfamily)
MVGKAESLLERALSREASAVRSLIDELTPVIQARVVRALARRKAGPAAGRSARQEMEDMAQEVFVALFADDARVLRGWNKARGLSLVNYVGLVAERQVVSILRSGRRSPWTDEPTALDTLAGTVDDASPAEVRIASREAFAALLDRLRATLTPNGLDLFYALFVDEESVKAVCERTGMTEDAVYQAKSRIAKVIKKLAAEIEAERESQRQAAAPAVQEDA